MSKSRIDELAQTLGLSPEAILAALNKTQSKAAARELRVSLNRALGQSQVDRDKANVAQTSHREERRSAAPSDQGELGRAKKKKRAPREKQQRSRKVPIAEMTHYRCHRSKCND